MAKYVYESPLGYRYVSELAPEECADQCIRRLMTQDDIDLIDRACRASSDYLYTIE